MPIAARLVGGNILRRFWLVGIFSAWTLCAQKYTRGVGIYPGDPREDFSPAMHIDSSSYRNLALHRPAFQSSSYDYNLTAQLITDGIRETKLPRSVAVSTSEPGLLGKNERESVLDDNRVSGVELHGGTVWVQLEIRGEDLPPEVDRVDLDASVKTAISDIQEWTIVASGSDDAQTWEELGHAWGMARPGGELKPSIPLRHAAHSRFYRVSLASGRPLLWHVGELKFYDRKTRIHIGGPYEFASAWSSAGRGEEWVYVDLGATCVFDRIVLYWIRRPLEGSVQASDDAVTWQTLQPLAANSGNIEEMRLKTAARGRYVRVLMTRAAGSYVLSEVEVYGRGGPVAHAKDAQPSWTKNRCELAGGAWRLQRDSLVNANGETVSSEGFDDSGWLVATVPGTVLSTYLNVGAIPDPNFGDNQLVISDSFFYADFWYRDKFIVPPVPEG